MTWKTTALSACLVLSGCTTSLQVNQVSPEAPGPRSGLIYSLPYTRYDVVVTRRFIGCADGATIPGYTYSASPVASTHPDPSKTYSIDYESLSSAFKTSDLKVTWGDDRTLTSLNASATDKTGDVIVNTITGLATLAVTVASGGGGGRAAGAECEAMIMPQAKEALLHRKKLDAQQEVATSRLKAITARLTALQGVTSQMGQRLDGKVQATLLAIAEQVIAAKAAQEAIATATANNEKTLTETITVTLAQNGMLGPSGVQSIIIPGGTRANTWVRSPRAVGNFRATLLLRAAPTAIGQPDSSEPAEPGIRYRVPADGMLVLCMSPEEKPKIPGQPFNDFDETPTADMPDCTKINPAKIRPLLTASVPQLGRVAVWPFRNGPFQDNSIAGTLGPDGPTMFEYKVNTASAETASAAFAKAAGAIDTGVKGVLAAPTTILTTKANKITAQNTLITAQATRDTAEQVGLLQSSTALLNAQTANLAAQQALNKQQTSNTAP